MHPSRPVALLLAAAVAGGVGPAVSGAEDDSGAAVAGPRWKAILIAGDSSAPVFDNAVRDLGRLLERRGVAIVATFTADRARVSDTVHLSTHEELQKLPERVRVEAGDGCLVFATSHGTIGGLRLPQDPVAKILSPDSLNTLVAHTCGDAPTVVVVSACHSGTFIRWSTTKPNRIILTAARDVRRSFGCRPERRYTFYDGCLLTEFAKAATWRDLHDRLRGCIEAKEAKLKDPPSEPQAYFGRHVKDLPLPRLREAAGS